MSKNNLIIRTAISSYEVSGGFLSSYEYDGSRVIDDISGNRIECPDIKSVFGDYGCSCGVICENALSGCQALTAFNVANVVSVCNGAFCGCTGLSNMYIQALSSLDVSAFAGCSAITSLYLPTTYQITEQAFTGCDSVRQLIIPNLSVNINSFDLIVSLPNLEQIYVNNGLYHSLYWKLIVTNDGRTIVAAPPKISGVVNESQIETVNRMAFNACGLSACMLRGVKEIGNYAFSGSKIEYAWFPNLVTLCPNAFQGCDALTAAIMPNLAYADDNVFENCTRLMTFDFSKISAVGRFSFNGCGIVSADCGSMISAGWQAFYNCSRLSSISCDELTFADELAFAMCSSLSAVSAPSLLSYGDGAFSDCGSLVSVNFPECVHAGLNGFTNDIRLRTVLMPKLSVITPNVFDNRFIEYIDISNVKTIEDGALQQIGMGCTVVISGNSDYSISDGDELIKRWRGEEPSPVYIVFKDGSGYFPRY